MRQELELLPVQRDHADLVFLCAAREQALSHLVDEPRLHLVLNEVSDTGVERGDIVCIDEDGLTADVVRNAISAYSANEFRRTYLSSMSLFIQQP